MPKLVEVLDSAAKIPPATRSGFWQDAMKQIMAKPGEVFHYEDVSPTKVSDLRKDYGVEIHTRNSHEVPSKKNPDKTTTLCDAWIVYDPTKVEQIKAEAQRKSAERKAAYAKRQAAKQAKQANGATKATTARPAARTGS